MGEGELCLRKSRTFAIRTCLRGGAGSTSRWESAVQPDVDGGAGRSGRRRRNEYRRAKGGGWRAAPDEMKVNVKQVGGEANAASLSLTGRGIDDVQAPEYMCGMECGTNASRACEQ